MGTQLEHIPAELKLLPRWVNYILVTEPGKPKPSKPPINPRTLNGASVNSPGTWGTFEQAVQGIGKRAKIRDATGEIQGIGFILGAGYFGVDLDEVFDGVLEDWAADLVTDLNSYTEFSPSGKGLHVLCKGSIPQGFKRNRVEMYSDGRYFTVTGNLFRDKPIEERTDKAAAIFAKYGPIKALEGAGVEGLPDRVKQALNSPAMALFQRLWAGNYNDYTGTDGQPDHSKGDHALCLDLANLTDGDPVEMDNLFRQSGMYRDKWDEKRSGDGSTYGELTISKALERYTPGGGSALGASPVRNSDDYSQTRFDADQQRFKDYKLLKTGFEHMDKVSRGITPGFYILGGISGGGKTTLSLQMADNIAKQGQHVLYFALEQAEFELVSKSLSRLTYQLDKEKAVESWDIMKGDNSPIVQKAKAQYWAEIAPCMHIIPSGFNSSAANIIERVEQFIKEKGIPVVFVDYLQAFETSGGIREGVDAVLGQLKNLQTKHKLILILLSLLNRSNYLYPVDFTSFKESGKIEATADIAWGLQLQILTKDAMFEEDPDKRITAKRKAVQAANEEDPRKVEIQAIKTRYSKNYKCKFKYHAAFDLFEEEPEDNQAKTKSKAIRL